MKLCIIEYYYFVFWPCSRPVIVSIQVDYLEFVGLVVKTVQLPLCMYFCNELTTGKSFAIVERVYVIIFIASVLYGPLYTIQDETFRSDENVESCDGFGIRTYGGVLIRILILKGDNKRTSRMCNEHFIKFPRDSKRYGLHLKRSCVPHLQNFGAKLLTFCLENIKYHLILQLHSTYVSTSFRLKWT